MEVGMRAAIPPIKSGIVCSTYQRVYFQCRHKEEWNHSVSEPFVRSVEQNEGGGEVIEGKGYRRYIYIYMYIIVEGKEIDNQPQGKIKNSGRGFLG